MCKPKGRSWSWAGSGEVLAGPPSFEGLFRSSSSGSDGTGSIDDRLESDRQANRRRVVTYPTVMHDHACSSCTHADVRGQNGLGSITSEGGVAWRPARGTS